MSDEFDVVAEHFPAEDSGDGYDDPDLYDDDPAPSSVSFPRPGHGA